MKNLIPFILSTILLAAGCSQSQKTEKKQVFHYNQESGIASLDPAFARDQATGWAINMLYNGLLQLDSNLNLQPAIAHRWVVDEAGTTYRFWLRQDVNFHENKCFNGTKNLKVTASDFVYSFKRLIDPLTASPGAWIFNDKLAGEGFYAINDSVFEIRLNAPFPPLPQLLTMGYCSVVPQEAVEFYGSAFRENPVGTGPFQMAFWYENEALSLHKNPNYFEFDGQQRMPYLDAVMVHFLPDKQSAFLAFLQNKLDFISGVDPAFKDEVLQKDGSLHPKYEGKIELQKSTYLNTEYLGILLDPSQKAQHPALADKRVRQALNYGFDRKQMIRYLRNNIGIPGTAGLLPPGLPGFDSTQLEHYSYQPEKAKKLLSEAGYGNKPLKLQLETNPAYLDLCIFIQRQWQQLGIELRINTSPGPTLRQLISKGEASLFRASWIADYPDAENYLALAYGPNETPNGPNYTRFKNPVFDELYLRSMQEPDLNKRTAIYKAQNALLLEEAPYIVLYYDQVLRLVKPGISGLSANAMNVLDLKRVKKTSIN